MIGQAELSGVVAAGGFVAHLRSVGHAYGVGGVEAHDAAPLDVDAGHTVVGGGEVVGVVETYVERSGPHVAVEVDGAVGAAQSEVPLPDEAGTVAQSLQHAGQGGLVRTDGQGRVGRQYAHVAPPGVLARQQGVARGRGGRGRGVGVREAHAPGGQAVEGRRADERGAVAAQVGVAHVVGQDADDVGAVGPVGEGQDGRETKSGERQTGFWSHAELRR